MTDQVIKRITTDYGSEDTRHTRRQPMISTDYDVTAKTFVNTSGSDTTGDPRNRERFTRRHSTEAIVLYYSSWLVQLPAALHAVLLIVDPKL